MLKIPRRASTVISLSLTVIFMLALITGAVVMPWLVKCESGAPDNAGDRANTQRDVILLVISYLLTAVAATADVFLFLLLLRVRAGQVFTDRSVMYLRGISWCCVLLGVLFCILGKWFLISFGVGFAALFVGICLRVVKNVIEEATAIKGENDLTI